MHNDKYEFSIAAGTVHNDNVEFSFALCTAIMTSFTVHNDNGEFSFTCERKLVIIVVQNARCRLLEKSCQGSRCNARLERNGHGSYSPGRHITIDQIYCIC